MVAAPQYHPSAPVTSVPATRLNAQVDSGPYFSARPVVDRGTAVTSMIVRKVILVLECTLHNLFQLLCKPGEEGAGGRRGGTAGVKVSTLKDRISFPSEKGFSSH